MTLRAIIGLVGFNLGVLGVGAGVLWGVRGWRWWTDFVRLSGVAYLLGISSLTTLLSLELVLGVPITPMTLLGSCGLLVASGLVAGHVRGHAPPRLRPPGWQLPGISLFAALFVAAIVVYLAGLFRAARLASVVHEWDAWAFWIPRANGLYWLHRLEPEFLVLLPQRPSYPPGLTTLHVSAFHAMGSADPVTLHLQYWFLATGFVGAVTGLLWRRVHHAVLFPVVLLALVAPSLVERMTAVYGDLPLAYLAALAALLIALWLDEQRAWQLAAASLLLAGAMLTKREGILFAACILVAALAASWPARRTLWKRLATAGVVAVALALPWRIWFMAHGLAGDGPDAGYLGAFEHLDRVWPSFKLVARTLVDPELWPAVPLVAGAALALAALGRAWTLSAYTSVFIVAVVGSSTWTIWANTSLRFTQEDGGNPIVRLTSTPILVLAVLTPLLLQRAWSRRRPDRTARADAALPIRDAIVWRSRWAWTVVLLGVLAHPGAMLVGYSGSGLPGGPPSFPNAASCASRPARDEPVRVVLGYADSYPAAYRLRERASAAGLDDIVVRADDCGRALVLVDDVVSQPVARELVELGRAGGLQPTLQRAAP